VTFFGKCRAVSSSTRLDGRTRVHGAHRRGRRTIVFVTRREIRSLDVRPNYGERMLLCYYPTDKTRIPIDAAEDEI